MKLLTQSVRFIRSHRHLAMLVGAATSGFVALQAGNAYMSEQLEAERARMTPVAPRTIEVVVAARDLGKGDEISEETMAVREIPAEFVSSAAIRPGFFEAVKGARLGSALREGEALVASVVVGGENRTFSQRLAPGARALTIPVDDVNAISGMLQPGDRIDLFFTAVKPGADGVDQLESTQPLFQSVHVLATGRQLRAGSDERGARTFSHVTVEVTPEQAQRLVVAQRSGRLTAMLRNPDDADAIANRAMDARQLLGVVESKRIVRQRSLPQGPQIIIGGMGDGGQVQRLPIIPSAGLVAPTPAAPGRIEPTPEATARGAGPWSRARASDAVAPGGSSAVPGRAG